MTEAREMAVELRSIPRLGLASTRVLHIAAILALSGLVFVRWWRYLGSAVPLIDEQIYLDAFRAAFVGRSPYSVDGYYYPVAFALAGGSLLSVLGQTWLLVLVRVGTVLGLVSTVWLSLNIWRTTWMRRVVVAAAYLSLAPAVRLGQQTGNISFAVIGALILALVVWHRYPLVSGLLMGAGVAVKPLGPLATLALFAHRPSAGGRRHLVAGALSMATGALLLLPISRFLEMSQQTIDRLPYIRSTSVQRIFNLMGVGVSPVVIAAIVGLVTVVVVRKRPIEKVELLCVATTAAVVATPIIWPHTLLLSLPVQVAALARAVSRRKSAHRSATVEEASVTRKYELILVVLAIAASQLSEGVGAVDDRGVPFQLIALSVPVVAAPALTAYLLATAERSGRKSETNG